MAELDDAGLVARVAAGDGAAFAPLYRIYLPLVLRWTLRATGDRELAADLTAEVFAAALFACRRYRPDAGPVGAWLIGIANNKLRESRRRRRIEDSARRKLGVEPMALTDVDLERVDELVGVVWMSVFRLSSSSCRLSNVTRWLRESSRSVRMRRSPTSCSARRRWSGSVSAAV